MKPSEMVREFMVAFETPKDINLWVRLVTEEDAELSEAMARDIAEDTLESLTNVLKEACDLAYVVSGLSHVLVEVDPAEILAASEPFYTRFEKTLDEVRAVFPPEALDEAFKRVHASNMSKLGDDGKPVRRGDGKVLKGPNYKPPVLTDLVQPVYLKSRQTLVIA